MAGVTVPYGFELPAGGEKISVPLLNRNFEKTNDALKDNATATTAVDTKYTSTKTKVDGIAYSEGVSSYEDGSWDFTGSIFTKFTFASGKAIIIAEIYGKAKAATTWTNSGGAYQTKAGVIPAAYRPVTNLSPVPIAFAGNGTNVEGQAGITPSGDLIMRAAGSSTVIPSGAQFLLNLSYRAA